MNKNSTSLLVTVISAYLLTSCAISSSPSCTDNDVKETVLELAKNHYKSSILNAWHVEHVKTPYNNMNELQVNIREFYAKRGNIFLVNSPYEKLKPYENENIHAQFIIEELDKQIEKMGLVVKNIRTKSKDTEIMKIVCDAELVDNIDTKNIVYSVQNNEDGEIYVEVGGL